MFTKILQFSYSYTYTTTNNFEVERFERFVWNDSESNRLEEYYNVTIDTNASGDMSCYEMYSTVEGMRQAYNWAKRNNGKDDKKTGYHNIKLLSVAYQY